MDADQAPDEVCDCAPTSAERRALWRPLSRRGAMVAGALGVAAVGSFGSIGLSAGSATAAYNPDDYPSWEDVERARQNEAAKNAEIASIENHIAQLKQHVAETQAAAKAAADAYYEASQAAYEAGYRAEELQRQADEQAKKADEAAQAAARVAAQLYRNSSDSTSLEVLFAGSAANADELLAKLGQMDKLFERNETIYADAVAARDSAQSLSDQAKVAREERDRLQKIAEEKLVAAQEAQAAAEQALADQKDHLIVLEQQLAALKDTTSETIKDYEAGVEARRKEEERLRREAEERRRQQEEEARRRLEEQQRQQQEQQDNGGGAPAPPPPPPPQGGQGWVRPSDGSRTSDYGWRNGQCGPNYCASSFHAGVDLAAGCWSPIYAAGDGVVEMAGYWGGYGNYVRIDHGNGIGTGYGHIADGGISVYPGQWVSAGTVIAHEGNTGNSFGCHLHYEVYVWGNTVNPDEFMNPRGVYL